jgi:hypothetical protein
MSSAGPALVSPLLTWFAADNKRSGAEPHLVSASLSPSETATLYASTFEATMNGRWHGFLGRSTELAAPESSFVPTEDASVDYLAFEPLQTSGDCCAFSTAVASYLTFLAGPSQCPACSEFEHALGTLMRTRAALQVQLWHATGSTLFCQARAFPACDGVRPSLSGVQGTTMGWLDTLSSLRLLLLGGISEEDEEEGIRGIRSSARLFNRSIPAMFQIKVHWALKQQTRRALQQHFHAALAFSHGNET